MYNVQEYIVLYNNAIPPVICDGWHFLLTWPQYFNKSGIFGI